VSGQHYTKTPQKGKKTGKGWKSKIAVGMVKLLAVDKRKEEGLSESRLATVEDKRKEGRNLKARMSHDLFVELKGTRNEGNTCMPAVET